MTMLPDRLLDLINDLVEVAGKAEACRVLAQISEAEVDRANMRARADYWNRQLSDQHAALTAAINTAVPPTVYATPDLGMPVRVLDNDTIEVRGTLDRGNRTVSVALHPGQASAVGAMLIACAAVTTDRANINLATIVPPIPDNPPKAPTV
jgi:hypothetical protein